MSTEGEKINGIIQDIAAKHDVVISKDDPIMVLHTMNEHLINDTKSAQNDLLGDFKSQMEVISDQWSIEARKHSDRILNSAIVSSKVEVARVMEEQSCIIIDKWKNELSTGFSQVNETIESSRQAAILNIIASFITLISACIVLYVFIAM